MLASTVVALEQVPVRPGAVRGPEWAPIVSARAQVVEHDGRVRSDEESAFQTARWRDVLPLALFLMTPYLMRGVLAQKS